MTEPLTDEEIEMLRAGNLVFQGGTDVSALFLATIDQRDKRIAALEKVVGAAREVNQRPTAQGPQVALGQALAALDAALEEQS